MEVTPQEIEFRPPFDQPAVCKLKLQNTTDSLQIYKIKTTAPHLYCVKPNASSIKKGETLEISITRQPREVQEGDVCKDKFLVLSTEIKESELTDKVSEMWTTIEKGDKSKVDAKKLRVVYLYGNNSEPARESRESPSSPGPAYVESSSEPVKADAKPEAKTEAKPEAKDTTESKDAKDTTEAKEATPEVKPEVKPEAKHSTEQTSTSNNDKDTSASQPSLAELGVAPKSEQVGEGDAKTGPKLDNANIPEGDGPKPEHDVSPEFKKEEEEKAKAEQGKFTTKNAQQDGKFQQQDGKYQKQDGKFTEKNDQGKYTEKSAGKFTEKSAEKPEDVQGPQEVSLSLTFVLVLLAFFIGWRFF